MRLREAAKVGKQEAKDRADLVEAEKKVAEVRKQAARERADRAEDRADRAEWENQRLRQQVEELLKKSRGHSR